MRKHYTTSEKSNGELAVRYLSKKAQDFYYGSDMNGVFELDTDDGYRYDVTTCCGDYSGLTLDELGKLFEELYDALEGDAE